tara:strand:- start:512 stop:757 length:246 start_codon:yes stop_codon:yes gene_type:complete
MSHNQSKHMTHTISLKESRALIVVKEMKNGTKIVSEPDQDGWVKLEVVISDSWDVLQMYHAGMEARAELDREFKRSSSMAF